MIEREEEKNEKNYKFFAICFIIIQGFIIGVFLIFFIGVTRVNAAEYQDLPPQNIQLRSELTNGNISNSINCTANDLTSCYLNFDTTSNQRFRISFQHSYYASASNQIQFSYTVGLRMGNEQLSTFLNWNNVTVQYVDSSGSVIKNVSANCTTTGSMWSRDYHENLLPMREAQWNLTTTCNEINPGGNANRIQIITPFPTGVSFIRQFYFYSKSLTLKRIVGTITDTDRLENAINSNTQNIINNNNSNTQNIINSQNNTTNAINNMNDSITDANIDNPSQALGNMENYFGQNGVISDLLLLPVRMYQSIVNSIGGTCSSFTLGTLLGHELVMPCIDISSRLGSSLYSVIDILISGLFILTIRKKFVDIFEHFTSLKTGGNELE